METFLVLAMILLVSALLIWLRRSLADDWPPAPPELGPEPIPPVQLQQAASVSPAVDVSGGSVGPVAVARPQAESRAVTQAEPAPEQRPQPLAAEAVLTRLSRAALLIGGLALMILAQITSRTLLPGERLGAFILTAIGALAVILAGQAVMTGQLPARLEGGLRRLGAFLQVAPSQVILLALAPCFAWLARLAAGNDLLAHQATVAILAWLAAIGLVVAGSVTPPAQRDWPKVSITRVDVIASLGLFVLALALRAWATARFPDTFSGDEGSAALHGMLFLDGRANNILNVGWFSFPSLYFLVQSAAVALGGQTVEAVRLTSAVAGALTVVAVYWLARAMFDRLTGLLAGLYLAAAHYHVHMSRIALNNIWDGLFGTLAVLGLWSGWRSGRRAAFILCGLALGLGQYFYVSIRLLPVLFLIWAGVAWWRQREQFRQRLPGLIIAAFIALVVFLPLGMYFVDKPDEFQAPLNRVTVFGPWLENELARGERTTARIILDQAVGGALGYTHEPLRLLYNPGSPLLLAGAATLFVLGLLWGLFHFDLRYLLLLLPLLGAIAANAVSQDSPASQRYIMAMPLVAIFVALPVAQLAAWLRESRPRYQAAILAGALGVIAIIALADLNYYFNRIYDEGYELGGLNTRVATEVAYYLQEQEPADKDVLFFGFPRMGYYSLSTIPYLAPEANGQDIIDPLFGPPDWPLGGPTLIIFLPERLGELDLVRQRFPDGRYEEIHGRNGELLFAVYETSG